MKRDAFLFLIKQEMRRWGKGRKFRRSGLFYLLALLLSGFGFVTYFARHGNFHMEGLLYVAFGLPYMIVGMSNFMVQREWSKHTLGWWLTLPYARGWLIGAKFAASLLQTLLIYTLIFAGCVLLGVYAMVLSPSTGSLSELFASLLPGYALLISLTPFLVAYGMFMGVLQSRMVALTPLLWVVFGLSMSFGTQGVDAMLKANWSGPVLLILASSLVLAFVLGKVMAKLLEKNVRV